LLNKEQKDERPHHRRGGTIIGVNLPAGMQVSLAPKCIYDF
jgi:hypothetical protein